MDEKGALSCNCPAWIFKRVGGERTCGHVIKAKRILREQGMNPKRIWRVDRRKETIKSVLRTYRSGDIITPKQELVLLRRDFREGALTESGYKRAVKEVLSRKNPVGLYKAFHGTQPMKVRKVRFESPNPKEPLIKIGRLSQINYIPEYPSQRRGTEFYHRGGDLGHKVIKSNAILATDKKGKNLYIIKDKGTKYPIFTERGIIG